MRKFEYVKRVSEDVDGQIVIPEFNLPKRGTSKSGGYDFFCPEGIWVAGNGVVTYVKTGVKVSMPDDEILLLCNRSSNPKKKELILASGVGVVDADYYSNPDNDGEIAFPFTSTNPTGTYIKAGEKLGQGIFVKYGLTMDDNATEIRISGFGSTGK